MNPPTKTGDAPALRTAAACPNIRDIWQLMSTVRTHASSRPRRLLPPVSATPEGAAAAASAPQTLPAAPPARQPYRPRNPIRQERQDLTIENPTGLDLTWLGTSSGSPSTFRNVSCCVVRTAHASHLVDCGEGTQRQLIHTSIKANSVKRIFITHMHGDHCFGLGGMLCTISSARSQANDNGPIYVYGPPGLQEYVRASLDLSDTVLGSTIIVTEFAKTRPGPGGNNSAAAAAAAAAAQASAPSAAPGGPLFYMEPVAVDKHKRLFFATLGPDTRSLSSGPASRRAAAAGGPGPYGQSLDEDYGDEWTGGDSEDDRGSYGRRGGADSRGGYGRDRYRDYDLEKYEAGPYLTWTIPIEDGWRVVSAELLHRVPCWGYVFQEPGSPGHVDMERCAALGLQPGPLLRDLKAGRPITLPSGQVIQPRQVVGPPIPGRKAVVMGDTYRSTHLTAAATGADVLVHEATFSEGMERKALISRHSTAQMAGGFARDINARLLILTHFSPRYEGFPLMDTSAEEESRLVAGLIGQAKDEFGSGNVVAAHDYYTVRVPRRGGGGEVQTGRGKGSY